LQIIKFIPKKGGKMVNLLDLNKKEILGLWPEAINRRLSPEEIVHIFREMDGFWEYDYTVAFNKPGYHALLKSGNHSDGFLNSKVVICYYNLCRILAQELYFTWLAQSLPFPTKVAGIPNGANDLGNHLSFLMGVEPAKLVKKDGKIKINGNGNLEENDKLLLVEDIFTTGTGFKETVKELNEHFPEINIMPFLITIINRGRQTEIKTEKENFEIIAPVTKNLKNCAEEKCQLCQNGSVPIQPKKNWELLINSQK